MEIIHKEKLNNTCEYYWCKKRNTQHYLDWGAALALFKEIQGLPRVWFISIFDTSTLHLPLAHVSSPISETIHVSPLITTIKKNKKVSLLFIVRLNIFHNSSSSIFTPHLYIYFITFTHFNYLLKCSNTLKK